MNILCVKFVIGSTVSLPVPPKQLDFYGWLCGNIFGVSEKQCTVQKANSQPIVDLDRPGRAKTIPQAFDQCFAPYGALTTDGVLLIDLDVYSRATLNARTLLVLFKEVLRLCCVKSSFPRRIVILSEYALPAGDMTLQPIEQIRARGFQVFIVDERGYIDGGADIGSRPEIPSTEIRARRVLSKGKVANTLRLKLVRQVGHFAKTVSGQVVCLRHFYDGSGCVTEVADYLWLKLRPQMTTDSVLVYHSARSPWLVSAIRSLGSKLQCEIVSKDEFLEKHSTLNVHVVVDFIDSGKTLLEFLKAANITPCSLVAIVSTKRIGEEHSEIEGSLGKEYRRTISEPDREQMLDYVQVGEYDTIGPHPCPLCRLGLGYEALPKVHSLIGLRSVDFWSMLLDSGVAVEQDTPTYREELQSIVWSERLLKRYGSFLAFKVDQLARTLDLPLNLTIIHPESEEASGWFAWHLEQILGLDAVGIPRATIDRFAVSASSCDFTEAEKHGDWFKSLTGSPINACLVVDDIIVTGRSVSGMVRVLTTLGMRVAAVVPIVAFSTPTTNWASEVFFPLYMLGGPNEESNGVPDRATA